MNCRDIQNRISMYVDRETSPEENRLIRAHVYACPECQAELQAVEAVKSSLRGLSHCEPPAGMEDRLLAAVAQQAETQKPARRFAPFALVAATFTVAFMGWLAFARLHHSSVEPTKLSPVEDYRASQSLGDPMSPIPNVSVANYGR